ncbi:hypothetical protein [Aurantimonas marina]|uniref:hypothetical protein n=1 Tax=Aurantimonas marina TaxID=2780508 RepID=UPI0019D2A977|nr:hypothetical protein [Aurantimonas marina]
MTTSPLPDLLKILSDELNALAEMTEAMHDLICTDHPRQDAPYVRAVQSIDRTQQTLENLATFLAVAGDHAPAEYEVALQSALETVRLGDLKNRLALSRQAITSASQPVELGGDFELFA